MPVNTKQVYVGTPDQLTTGAVLHAPVGTKLPTLTDFNPSQVTINEAFKDGGYVSSDGVTLTPDMSTSDINDWSGALIRRVGQDRTVLLSTHILQEVNALCNRVVIINHGRIVGDYDDLPAMLAGDGRHRRFEVQFLHAPQRDTLPRIGDVHIIKEYDERHFLVAAGRDVRGDLFDLAVATGNKLLLLRPVEDTIEEVFRQLTNDK